MIKRQREFAFVRLLSSAVISQAVLSAGNFVVGLVLIRATTDSQYGYYVLTLSAIILLVSLQNAFFSPPLALRLTGLDNPGRAHLVGRLYRLQQQWLIGFAAIAVLLASGLYFADLLDKAMITLVLVAIVASLVILQREFFRMVLFAYRHAVTVLKTDIVYVLLILVGVLIAISSFISINFSPATTTIAALGIAALASSVLLFRHLWRFEPWRHRGEPGILREIIPVASWSTAGAAVHWTFSQGYIYLVAATLDIGAVAAIAATRLLLMPVNLLSTGIGSLMLPLASNWLQRHGVSLLWRRLWWFALGLSVITLSYFSVLWWFRDWIFSELLNLQITQADTLLLLWGAIFLLIVIRDQVAYLLAAQGRFRVLTSFTLVCAVLSLIACYFGMLRFGMTGALMGILFGEIISVIGIITISLSNRSFNAQPTKNKFDVNKLTRTGAEASLS